MHGSKPSLPTLVSTWLTTTTASGYVVVNDYHYCCATLTGTLISANIGAPAVSREDALKSTRKIFLDNILKGAPWLRLRLYSTTRSIKIMTQNNDNGSTFLYHLG